MQNKFVAAGLATALALTVSAALAQDKKADADSQSFIKTAIQHNYAEIDSGKLAQQKGKSQAVRDFGAMMARDHGDANTKAIPAAKAVGIDKPPEGADAMHQAGYLKLKVLSGDTFDRSYVSAMIKDHENDVKEFQKRTDKPDAVGAFAKDTLPVLQKHLDEIKKVQAQITAPTTGSGNSMKK